MKRTTLCIFFFLLIPASPLTVQSSFTTDVVLDDWKWGEYEIVSSNMDNSSNYPNIDVDSKGNSHIVWAEHLALYYSMRDATTNTWTTPELLSQGQSNSTSQPEIALDTLDVAHVVWVEATDLGSSGIDQDVFYRFLDTGSSWSQIVVVSTESTENSYNPQIGVDALNNVHVAWTDYTDYDGSGADLDIFYKQKNSTAWSQTLVLSDFSPGSSTNPSLSVDNYDRVHVVWQDDYDYFGSGTDTDIFYLYWDPLGASWSDNQVISDISTSGSFNAEITNDQFGGVHIVWEDVTDYSGAGTDIDIFYRFFNPEIYEWTSVSVVSTEGISDSYHPTMAVDSSNNLHIFWADSRFDIGFGGDGDLVYKSKPLSFFSWGDVKEVFELPDSSVRPIMVIDTFDFIHLTWNDQSDLMGAGSDTDVFYRQLSGLPMTPTTPGVITSNPSLTGLISFQWSPVPAVIGYNIYRTTEPIYTLTSETPILITTQTNYTESISEPDTYFFGITSINVEGESLISSPIAIDVILTDNQITVTVNNDSVTTDDENSGGFANLSAPTLSVLLPLILLPILLYRRKR